MWPTDERRSDRREHGRWREITPSCCAFTYTPDPCDPKPRFIAPFDADANDIDHWVAGGQYVWETHEGWDTRCSDYRVRLEDHRTTPAAASSDDGRRRRTATRSTPRGARSGATPTATSRRHRHELRRHWHRSRGPTSTTAATPLPQRYVFNLTVDPRTTVTSTRSTARTRAGGSPAPGAASCSSRTTGARRWTDITGDLPDAPGDDLVIARRQPGAVHRRRRVHHRRRRPRRRGSGSARACRTRWRTISP